MSGTATARDAEHFFHGRIPITRAMGVRVLAASDEAFIVEAPVALNFNHLHTGFGGSINAIATLAGYGLLWQRLHGTAAEIVVAESSMRFLRPVKHTIRAVCEMPARAALEAFTDAAKRAERPRIQLRVTIEEAGVIAARFRGTFVAVSDIKQPTRA